ICVILVFSPGLRPRSYKNSAELTANFSYSAAFPKLWVANQKLVAKFCQVNRQSFFWKYLFFSFICKLDKNNVVLLPLFSEFSIELQACKGHQNFDITW